MLTRTFIRPMYLLRTFIFILSLLAVAMCPSNKTVYIELGYEGTVIFWEKPTLLGSSEDVTLISQSHSNDTIFPPGVTEVMFTFTDALSGNNFSCSFFVEIIPSKPDSVFTVNFPTETSTDVFQVF